MNDFNIYNSLKNSEAQLTLQLYTKIKLFFHAKYIQRQWRQEHFLRECVSVCAWNPIVLATRLYPFPKNQCILQTQNAQLVIKSYKILMANLFMGGGIRLWCFGLPPTSELIGVAVRHVQTEGGFAFPCSFPEISLDWLGNRIRVRAVGVCVCCFWCLCTASVSYNMMDRAMNM